MGVQWGEIYIYIYLILLVVSTHLKNISQIGSFPQVGVKIKYLKPPTSYTCNYGTLLAANSGHLVMEFASKVTLPKILNGWNLTFFPLENGNASDNQASSRFHDSFPGV